VTVLKTVGGRTATLWVINNNLNDLNNNKTYGKFRGFAQK
jgi:hypothetical protein